MRVPLAFLLGMLHYGFGFTQICKPFTGKYQGPELPKLPDSFSTHVEITVQGDIDGAYPMNGTFSATEYYDKQANRGAFQVYRGGKRSSSIYHYDTDEHFKVDEDERTCSVEPIKPSAIFGPGGHDIKSVKDVFKFGSDYPLEYKEDPVVRNIKCRKWMSCRNNATSSYVTEYHFSDPTWNSASGQESVLVQILVYGQSLVINGTSNYTKNDVHSYNFFSFRSGKPKAEVFETPSGIFCAGQKLSNPTPKVAPEFEASLEMISVTNKTVGNVREFYDFKEKFFRFDHVNRTSGKAEHVIQDFNTGLVYIIDRETSQCVIAPLNRSWVGSYDDPEHELRLKKSDELFHLEKGGDRYKYEGTRNVRNIDADVWIGHVNWTRSGSLIRTKYEWHFSREPWKIHSDLSSQMTKHVPLQLRIYRGNNDEHLTIINFFNYDVGEPSSHILWPVRDCYWENRHYMYFRLEGSFAKYAHLNERAVMRGIRDAVSNAGEISTFRVSSLLIFNSSYNNVIAVRLYVLGVPPVHPGIVLHPKHTIGLTTAVDKIRQAIQKGNLHVTFDLKGSSQTLTAQRDSYYETDTENVSEIYQRRSKGLGVGQVIGVTLGVIFIAVLLTVLAIYVVLKRKDINLFSYLRFK